MTTGPENLPPRVYVLPKGAAVISTEHGLLAPPRRTARDFLCALAGVPGIGEEMDYLGQLLVDLDRGPDAEASWEMLQARVHDQLDRIAKLLGRDTV